MKKIVLMALAAVVLAMPSMAQDEDWRWSQTIQATPMGYIMPSSYPDVQAGRTPQSIAEVAAAMPAFPSLENIYCPENKDKAVRAKFMPFLKSLDAALLLNGPISVFFLFIVIAFSVIKLLQHFFVADDIFFFFCCYKLLSKGMAFYKRRKDRLKFLNL